MSDPQLYTIGWICAITTEYTAACQFLDKEHSLPTRVAANDSNGYTLGEMAGHNVVIAVLPRGEYGLSSAASVAANMLNSFPNIRVGLMVGIGGGAPTSKNDIRLGDIVVSSPKDQIGGVYQYDFGKTIQGRKFQPTASLNQPPAVVLTAMSVLESKYEAEGHHIEEDIAAVFKRRPKLTKKYSRPNQLSDRLYRPHAIHPHDEEGDCEKLCGIAPADLVQRENRGGSEDNPAIHYGSIASANQLMKDATIRDALAKEKGILCFEMEAAGLMNRFPCLVVRGICDYSDSHKHNEWQGYAAMTAAAYTKNLLFRMVPSQVKTEEKISKVLIGTLEEHTEMTREHFQKQDVRYLNTEHQNCHQALKTSRSYEQFKNINPDRVEQTCQWALTHPLYLDWYKSNTNNLLWISADPGCGKSVLSKSLVDKELKTSADGDTVCYFFFKDNDEQNGLAIALCAVLHQLFDSQPHLLQHAMPAWRKNGSKLQQETDELWRILLAATSDTVARNTFCVLDALDECKQKDCSNLIAKLSGFHEDAASQSARQPWLKFIVTSRPYEDIQRGFQQIPSSLPAIRLRGEEENDQVRVEIDRVVKFRVAQLKKEISLQESTAARLEQTLLGMEHRTYLWLYLAVDAIRTTLQESFRPDEETIESVPLSVGDAYDKILAKVTQTQQSSVKIILQIIVGARRPLEIGEMALALGLATSRNYNTSEDVAVNA
ncbi:hypothetical protein D6C95_09389, partial [Aureobasidium pullulans]